jgi:hypothetical protein
LRPSPQSEDQKSEESVQRTYAKACTDARNIGIALEAYNVDFNVYPKTLLVLTTPVAYITEIGRDPFAASDATYQYDNPDTSWLVWSVGPDQADDHGKLIYDPTNGVFSKGDVIRRK